MTRKLVLTLSVVVFMLGDAFAEKGDPMMIWPIFVQLDLDAYHGAMIEKCIAKYPEYAESFRDGIAKWGERNMATIIEIRGLLRDRVRNAEDLSEAKVETNTREASAAWTQIFLKMVSSTTEGDWKDACTGKYADQTLRSLDFVKYRPSIVAAIPTLPVRQLRP